MPKRSKPPAEPPLRNRVMLSFDEDEYEHLVTEAKAQHLKVATYVRLVVLRRPMTAARGNAKSA